MSFVGPSWATRPYTEAELDPVSSVLPPWACRWPVLPRSGGGHSQSESCQEAGLPPVPTWRRHRPNSLGPWACSPRPQPETGISVLAHNHLHV